MCPTGSKTCKKMSKGVLKKFSKLSAITFISEKNAKIRKHDNNAQEHKAASSSLEKSGMIKKVRLSDKLFK
jgi:hypothetical protein